MQNATKCFYYLDPERNKDYKGGQFGFNASSPIRLRNVHFLGLVYSSPPRK